MGLSMKEFNDKYTIVIDSTSSTFAGLSSIQVEDSPELVINYIEQVDSSFRNYRYEVMETDSGKPVLEFHSDNDKHALETIIEEFNIKC